MIKLSSLYIAPLLVLISCTSPDRAGGGSSVETENVITATVLNQQGKPAIGANVQVRASWYLPESFSDSKSISFERDLITDSKGRFECVGLPLGNYVIEVLSDGQGAIVDFIHQDTSKQTQLPRINTSFYGSMIGRVLLPSNVASATLRIFGTERIAQTDSTGFFSIDSIPAGALRIRATVEDSLNAIAEALVLVRSGAQVNIGSLPDLQESFEDPFIWRYTRLLRVDSLFSDWMQPTPNQTVAIVRLDSNSFDFSEAMTNGHDLRFYDSQGFAMEYQMTHWDTDASKAIFYVRIPSISNTETIEMRWGCPGAIDRSSSKLWEGLPDSLALEYTSVLVGNFEYKSALTTLPSPIPATYWYLFTQDSTVIYNPTDWVEGIEPRDDSFGGNALHLTYTATDNKWFFLGASLDSEPRDFSSLDSIVFWLKGDGRVAVTMDNLGESGGKAVYNDTLSSTWTRYRITPSDFIPADQIGGNIGWNAVKDSITNISFFVSSGSDFWIDDVRIYGLNRDDLK